MGIIKCLALELPYLPEGLLTRALTWGWGVGELQSFLVSRLWNNLETYSQGD